MPSGAARQAAIAALEAATLTEFVRWQARPKLRGELRETDSIARREFQKVPPSRSHPFAPVVPLARLGSPSVADERRPRQEPEGDDELLQIWKKRTPIFPLPARERNARL
jgi:hypothetical protein